MDALMIAAATFVFTVASTALGTAITTTWRVGRMLDDRDAKFLKLMADHEVSDVQRFAEVNQKIQETSETLRHEFGETGTAIRQKMHEMEMWGRDNNLQKNSFYKAVESITASIGNLTKKLDGQILRDARVDRDRNHN